MTPIIGVARISLDQGDYPQRENFLIKPGLCKTLLRLWTSGLLILLTACASGSESSSSSSIQGFNMSGTWSPLAVECFDADFTSQTTYAILAFYSHPSTLLIQGNHSSLQISNNSCLAERIEEVDFQVTETLTDGSATLLRGLLQMTGRQSQTDTGAACEFTQSLTPEPLLPEISPSSWTLNMSPNAELEDQEISFFYVASGSIAYLSLALPLEVVGRPTDFCVLTYEKI